jgi:hypothetical protein
MLMVNWSLLEALLILKLPHHKIRWETASSYETLAIQPVSSSSSSIDSSISTNSMRKKEACRIVNGMRCNNKWKCHSFEGSAQCASSVASSTTNHLYLFAANASTRLDAYSLEVNHTTLMIEVMMTPQQLQVMLIIITMVIIRIMTMVLLCFNGDHWRNVARPKSGIAVEWQSQLYMVGGVEDVNKYSTTDDINDPPPLINGVLAIPTSSILDISACVPTIECYDIVLQTHGHLYQVMVVVNVKKQVLSVYPKVSYE